MRTSRLTTAALSLLWLVFVSAAISLADEPDGIGIGLEGYRFPHPVRFHPVAYRAEDLRMAYMDSGPRACLMSR
jgi:hypothetical protein